ncbi:MAG: undecaprenyl diphosphate synthase family protein, partial [Nocardioides sp.]|nr:undecaprenyl diphosphate synthase family protein [Nocardioides sp.]
MDGNRRWARQTGHRTTRAGHQAGAEHLRHLLGWCETWGIEHVTAYVLSADNIQKRSPDEVDYLFGLLVEAVPRFLAQMPRWALHVIGDGTLLTREAQVALADSEQRSALRPFHVTLAIGYDGLADIAAGIRNALRAVGDVPTPDDITANLAGGPVKEIDLVIRTGNEWRISGFFPWQAS